MSQQINLFNPIFLKQKKYFSATTMAQGLGLILLGSVLLSAFLAYRLNAVKAEAAEVTLQLAGAQDQLKQLAGSAQMRQKSAALENGIKKTETELKSLQQVFETLQKGDLGNTKGYSEYFKAFARQIVPGVWLTGLTIHGAGNEIGLQGRALQPGLVPEYIGRLKREPALKGNSFATLEMEQPKADPASPAAPADGKPRAVPNYIEFALRSANMPKEQPNAGGVQGQ